MSPEQFRAMGSLFTPISSPTDYWAKCKMCGRACGAARPGGLIANQRTHLKARHPRRYARAIIEQQAADKRASNDPWAGAR